MASSASQTAAKMMMPPLASRCIHAQSSRITARKGKTGLFQTLIVVMLMLSHCEYTSAFASRASATSRHSHSFCSNRNVCLFRHKTCSWRHFDSHSELHRKKLAPVKRFGSVNDNADSTANVSSEERNLGILVLLSVPLAWGTFEPAVRYVYTIQPAVPGFVFSVGYYLVAAVALSSLATISMARQEESQEQSTNGLNATDVGTSSSSSLPILGGMELGTYLFLGNGLQVLGLKTVPSDRAAFLLQLTTIFVPLVQAIIAGNIQAIPTKTWGACLIALSGVAVMSLDGSASIDLSNLTSLLSSLSQGDLLIVLAALAYTFHCIRLERFAKETSAITLAACKATTETVWSLALVGVLVAFATTCSNNSPNDGILAYAVQEGTAIADYASTMVHQVSSGSLSWSALGPAIAAILWTGLVTCGYTIYAQSFGQSRVNPTDANLIYTIQPLCTALFAFVLLGETLGPAGYVGGALIGSAVLIVATSDDGTNSSDDSNVLESVTHVNGDTSAITMVDSPTEVAPK